MNSNPTSKPLTRHYKDINSNKNSWFEVIETLTSLVILRRLVNLLRTLENLRRLIYKWRRWETTRDYHFSDSKEQPYFEISLKWARFWFHGLMERTSLKVTISNWGTNSLRHLFISWTCLYGLCVQILTAPRCVDVLRICIVSVIKECFVMLPSWLKTTSHYNHWFFLK